MPDYGLSYVVVHPTAIETGNVGRDAGMDSSKWNQRKPDQTQADLRWLELKKKGLC